MGRRTRVPHDSSQARAAWYLRAEEHPPCEGVPNCPECACALAEWRRLWAAHPLMAELDPIEAGARRLIEQLYTTDGSH